MHISLADRQPAHPSTRIRIQSPKGVTANEGAMAQTEMRWEGLAGPLPFLLLFALTHAQPRPPSEFRSTSARMSPRVDIAGTD
jgi:hypothetical protein